MEKFEIFKDVSGIYDDTVRAERLKSAVGNLHQYLNEKGYSAKIEHVKTFVQSVLINQQKTGITKAVDLATRVLLLENTKANVKNFGFPINKAKLLDLVEVNSNDVATCEKFLELVFLPDTEFLNLLELNDKNEVVFVAEATETIEQKNTYYARTNQSIEAAKALLKLVESLNSYQEKCNIILSQKVEGVVFGDAGYNIDSWYLRNMVAQIENN